MSEIRFRKENTHRRHLIFVIRHLISDLRYTQTRAGGIFIQIRSEASTEKPPNRFGNGAATE